MKRCKGQRRYIFQFQGFKNTGTNKLNIQYFSLQAPKSTSTFHLLPFWLEGSPTSKSSACVKALLPRHGASLGSTTHLPLLRTPVLFKASGNSEGFCRGFRLHRQLVWPANPPPHLSCLSAVRGCYFTPQLSQKQWLKCSLQTSKVLEKTRFFRGTPAEHKAPRRNAVWNPSVKNQQIKEGQTKLHSTAAAPRDEFSTRCSPKAAFSLRFLQAGSKQYFICLNCVTVYNSGITAYSSLHCITVDTKLLFHTYATQQVAVVVLVLWTAQTSRPLQEKQTLRPFLDPASGLDCKSSYFYN